MQTRACERNTRLLLCQTRLAGKDTGLAEETNISGVPFRGNEAWQQNIPVQHLIKMSCHASPNRFFCVSARVCHHRVRLRTGRWRQHGSWQGPRGRAARTIERRLPLASTSLPLPLIYYMCSPFLCRKNERRGSIFLSFCCSLIPFTGAGKGDNGPVPGCWPRVWS